MVTLAAVIAAFAIPPIPQDPAYHRFVDQRTLLGLANFWNVISNLGYLVVGIYGLTRLPDLAFPGLRPGYVIFCVAVSCVALGSSWYHHAPGNDSLVWDRLPMAPGFMALFALVLGERVSWRLSRRLLWPLVILGIFSVLYWAWTEARGVGDLRPYAVVQFLPVLLMPLLILLFPGNSVSARWLWWTFAGYVVAKIAEYFDAAIHGIAGISGHSIKHFVSSVSVLFAVLAIQAMRVPSTSGSDPMKARSAP